MEDDSSLFGGLFNDSDDHQHVLPPPTTHIYERKSLGAYPEKKELIVQLVGQHSLWSHCLWNAGVALAQYFEEFPELVKGKQVIEFGAGAGLPSFVSCFLGAKLVKAHIHVLVLNIIRRLS